MLRKILSSILVLLFVSSQAVSLTVDQAIKKIVNNSPELRVIFEKRVQTIANYQSSKSNYKPSVYFDYLYTTQKASPILDPAKGSWEGTNQFEVVLQQTIFDMTALAGISRFSYLVQSQEFENQKLLQSLIRVAVAAYYDVIQAQYIVAVNKEYLNEIRQIDRLVVKMQKQGNANLGNVSIVRSKIANARSESLSAESDLDRAKIRLAYLLNLVTPQDRRIANPDMILPKLTSKDFYDLADKMVSYLPVSLQSLQDESIHNSTDILLIRSNLCAAGYSLEASKGSWLPTVTGTVTMHTDQSIQKNQFNRYARLDVEAKYYLYKGGARYAEISSAESSIRELEYNYDIKIRDIRSKSYNVFNQLRNLEEQRAAIINEISASEQVDIIYKQQIKFGTRNLTDRLDNLSRLMDARIKLIGIDYSVLNTRLDILNMIGMSVKFFGFQNYLDYNKLNLC